MDSKTKKGSPDSKHINVNEDYEVKYWTNKFGITKSKLTAAVHAAGTLVTDVEAYLSKK